MRYPVKKGKGAVSDTQKRKLFGIGLEELARAVERYCGNAGQGCAYWKHGSTFFNSGYVDYLDDEGQSPTRRPSRRTRRKRRRRQRLITDGRMTEERLEPTRSSA
ncbi:MAG: hypothetical protein ACLUOI_20740 [Eisenbergiella sp.]